MNLGEELRLDVGWGQLAAMAWPRPGRPNILCLAGWMDNAASFVPLAQQLTSYNLVALDNAGHGRSDHRPVGSYYHFQNYVYDLDAVLDQLGWEQCLLMGHSLGTGVAISYTCASPDRIQALVLLDGLGVMTEPASKLPQRLKNSLHSVRKPHQHRSVHTSVRSAADIRARYNPMAPASSRLLAERALVSCANGWRWRTDGRAMWSSPAYLTEDQSTAIMQAIQCSALALYTDTLEHYLGDRLAIRLQAMPNLQARKIPGGHHVHMDDPHAVAQALDPFLTSLDSHHEPA